MGNDEYAALLSALGRIADALESQIGRLEDVYCQNSEWIAQQKMWREEDVARKEYEVKAMQELRAQDQAVEERIAQKLIARLRGEQNNY